MAPSPSGMAVIAGIALFVFAGYQTLRCKSPSCASHLFSILRKGLYYYSNKISLCVYASVQSTAI